MDRLLARAPELNQVSAVREKGESLINTYFSKYNQVIHDLDELLENTHDIPEKQVQHLSQVCLA